MRVLILRSVKCGRVKGPDDHYLQQFDTLYADRVIGSLRGDPGFCTACAADCIHCRDPYREDFSRDIAGELHFPDVLPYVLEHPASHVPSNVPRHEALLVFHMHEQILLEFVRRCAEWGTRCVIMPLEEVDWISNGARKQVHALGEKQGVEIAFPKPFCGFLPPAGSALDVFRRHFRIGYPEVELKVRNNVITGADVRVSAACGSTYYIARWLVGRNLDEDLATEVISKRLHAYPCTASMRRDPELEDDTPLHIAGKAHNKILSPHKKVETDAEQDRVFSPLGMWLPRPIPPTDNLQNIERAKARILAELASNPSLRCHHFTANPGELSPASILSAWLMLKREGLLPR